MRKAGRLHWPMVAITAPSAFAEGLLAISQDGGPTKEDLALLLKSTLHAGDHNQGLSQARCPLPEKELYKLLPLKNHWDTRRKAGFLPSIASEVV